MRESKIGLTRRLMDEGRWDEASAFRDEVRRALRIQGKTRREAGEKAWEAVSERFPPPPPEPTQEIGDPIGVEAAQAESDDFVIRQGSLVEHILAHAEHEVRAWAQQHDIAIPKAAFGHLAGGIVGAYWALGFFNVAPQLAPEGLETPVEP